jgi:hypothetical protein
MSAPKRTLRFTFRLGDDEFRRAWLREYYRRPGWRSLRVLGGPGFVVLGLAMASGSDLFMRVMGTVTVLFGVYYALKPWLMVRAITRRRRAAGHHQREFTITVRKKGVQIDDGNVRTELPWAEIDQAGEGPEYVWYQVRGGHRATIPHRALGDDHDALVEMLKANTRWV